MFFRDKSGGGSSHKTNLKKIDPPVSQALIFICEKCGKKLASSSDPDDNPSRILQRALKEESKKIFGKGKIRTVLTSCMDICPKGEIALGISQVSAHIEDQFFILKDPDSSSVIAELIKKATEKEKGQP